MLKGNLTSIGQNMKQVEAFSFLVMYLRKKSGLEGGWIGVK